MSQRERVRFVRGQHLFDEIIVGICDTNYNNCVIIICVCRLLLYVYIVIILLTCFYSFYFSPLLTKQKFSMTFSSKSNLSKVVTYLTYFIQPCSNARNLHACAANNRYRRLRTFYVANEFAMVFPITAPVTLKIYNPLDN